MVRVGPRAATNALPASRPASGHHAEGRQLDTLESIKAAASALPQKRDAVPPVRFSDGATAADITRVDLGATAPRRAEATRSSAFNQKDEQLYAEKYVSHDPKTLGKTSYLLTNAIVEVPHDVAASARGYPPVSTLFDMHWQEVDKCN